MTPRKEFMFEDSDLDPLHTAVLNQHEEIVELLLKHKASVTAETRKGNTALMLAALVGNPNLVKTLIEAKSDVHHKNKDSRTALSMAVYAPSEKEINLALASDQSKVTQAPSASASIESPRSSSPRR